MSDKTAAAGYLHTALVNAMFEHEHGRISLEQLGHTTRVIRRRIASFNAEPVMMSRWDRLIAEAERLGEREGIYAASRAEDQVQSR